MPDSSKLSPAQLYRNKFARASSSNTESTEGGSADFKEGDVAERLDTSKKELRRIVKQYFDNDSILKSAVNKIVKDSKDPMLAVANNDDAWLNNNPSATNHLEVIVRTDGSRPSFMIKDGWVDFKSSPAGDWKNKLTQNETRLREAIQCVGRISISRRHIGTGFLIHNDLIVTNRHVLQSIAVEDDGVWKFVSDTNIDFGWEYKARLSVNRRLLKKVVYCGPDFIDRFNVDHKKLDLAVIELAPANANEVPMKLFSWDQSETWAWPDTSIYTIGYPGDPGSEGIKIYSESVLDKLFKLTYGCKRIAPGIVLDGPDGANDWRLSHDASTLGGNSGSVMLVRSTEMIASGLHYGGDASEPRENWGHVLGKTLNKKGANNKTLEECLHPYNIKLTKSDG